MTLAEKLAKRIEGKPPMTAKEALDKLVENGHLVVIDKPSITGMFGPRRDIYGKSKD